MRGRRTGPVSVPSPSRWPGSGGTFDAALVKFLPHQTHWSCSAPEACNRRDGRTWRGNIDGRVSITERIEEKGAIRMAGRLLPATMKILHRCAEPRCGSLRITM